MTNLEKIECIAGTIRHNLQDYLILNDIKTNKEYSIPVNQLYNFEIIKGNRYPFYIERNDEKGKEFLSLIHPGLELGEVKTFSIKERITIETRDFFLLKNDIGCEIRVPAYKSQLGFNEVQCKVIGYRVGTPVLQNIDLKQHNYQIENEYSFEIVSFSTLTDKKGQVFNSIIVTDLSGNNIEIRAKPWQSKDLWSLPDIKCSVIGYNRNEVPAIKNTDDRHPKFELTQIISLKVSGFSERSYQKNKPSLKVIDLLDEYGCYHEVLRLPNQKDRIKIGDSILCKVEQISYRLHLKQVVIDDQYFYEFTEIIPDKSLERKYFTSQFDPTHQDVDRLQMKNQYDSKSGFYILTFCNKVLPKLFKDHIDRSDYKGAIEINSMIISIEEWILKKGIIQAFPNESTRRTTKEKVRIQIEKATIIGTVLPFISKGNLNNFYLRDQIEIKELYYLFLYSNIKLINALDFIKTIQSNRFLVPKDEYYLEKFNNILRSKKNKYLNNTEEDFLLLFEKSNVNNNNEFDQFIKWTYFQILVLDLLKRNSEANLLKAQLLRYYSTTQNILANKHEVLKYSFFILNNFANNSFNLPIIFTDNRISIDPVNLENQYESLDDLETLWKHITNAHNTSLYLDVEIKKKHVNGFEIIYNGIKGFLPSNHIYDTVLRNYNLSEINWKTRVYILNFSKEFNYFTAKQLPTLHDNYISENVLNISPQLNSIVKGVVKSVADYGIFLSTKYGDGLLHVTKISDVFLRGSDLEKLFKKNSEIMVKVIEVNKLSFSYKGIQSSIYKDEYKEFIDKLNAYQYDVDFEDYEVNEKDAFNLDYHIELEKGYIFEQFAASINSLNEKINYIKLAKQFFSNHKNARSYLLNIYIDYFNSLILLDEVIENYSFEKYEILKAKFNDVKSKINLKTLANFTGTDRLIYFINILTLFNETTNDSFEELYNYIKVYSNRDEEVLLKIVAKITLSNNLLLSETLKNENFSLKNLRRINDYIKNGIFTLNESESDRLDRELENNRKYWIDKINEDEGANLEFKSSFIKPIPDKKRKDQIASLKKKLTNNPNPQAILDKIDEINGLKAQKAIIHSALKTIAAFANTIGGYLLLGVSDDKIIYGLEDDYKSFQKIEEQSRDGFGKYFDAKLNEYFGDSFSSILLKKEFLKFPEGDILIIEVKPSTEEVFLLKDDMGNKSEQIYVRNLSSSEKLEGKELARFIRDKYRKQINMATEELIKSN